MAELDQTSAASDDQDDKPATVKTKENTFPYEDKYQDKVNFANAKSLIKIPGLGPKWAEKILLFRQEHGNLTQELLWLILPNCDKEKMAKIDFARNFKTDIDNQKDKDETTTDSVAEDYTYSYEDKAQDKINFANAEFIVKIPGLGPKWAEIILLFRKEQGNLTQELLWLILPNLDKEEMAKIDFTRNFQQITDNQEDSGECDMNVVNIGHQLEEKDMVLFSDEDVKNWDICLENDDIGGIRQLIKREKKPSYDTFLKAVVNLSTQRNVLKDLCRMVSNDLKRKIPGARFVYPAINPKNERIEFVAISTCPSDQKYVGGYPVKMKYAYGHCHEDYYIRDKEMKKDLCFKSREDENSINAAMRSAHDEFSKWPNYSRISFSFYKSSRFNEEDSNSYEIEKGCIVLFVFLKRWKPVGWDFFPGRFRDYEIDVRQSMCVKKHTLSMPSDEAMTSSGTVQGRIIRQGVNDRTFALTAAHLVLNSDEVDKSRTELEVYEGDGLDDHVLPVGIRRPDLHSVSVTKAALGGSEYFVDVALLELSEPLQQKDITFDWEKLGFTRQPTFLNCFRVTRPACNDIVMKYGMTTDLTLGKVRAIGASYCGGKGLIEIEHWKTPKTKPRDSPLFNSGVSGSPLPESRDSGSQLSTPRVSGSPLFNSGVSGSPLPDPGESGHGDSGSPLFNSGVSGSPLLEPWDSGSALSTPAVSESPFSEHGESETGDSGSQLSKHVDSETRDFGSPFSDPGKTEHGDSGLRLSEPGDVGLRLSEPGDPGLQLSEPGDSGSQLSETRDPRLHFSEVGDSGSLVFVVNRDILFSPPKCNSGYRGTDLSDFALVGMDNVGNEDDTISYAIYLDAAMKALGSEYTFDTCSA